MPLLTERATFPLPRLSRLHPAYAVWGAAAAVGATLVAGTVGLLWVGTVGAEARTGVTTTPVTSPVTACFRFDPIVCRAARVEARFAAAAAFSSSVRAARDLREIPKSASTSGEDPKAPLTTDTNALMKARRAGIWVASLAIFAFVEALDASTSARRVTSD
jgi:hypothetical protein